MLQIYQSVDLQQLIQHCIDKLSIRDSQNIFAEQDIIVPSMALAECLDQNIAEKKGISAQIHYRFWGMFAWNLVERIAADHEQIYQQAPLSAVAMQWKMFSFFYQKYALIIEDQHHPLYAVFTQVLKLQSVDQAIAINRLWTYAEEITQVFVGYIATREDWLEKWSNNLNDGLKLTDFIDLSQDDISALEREHYQEVLKQQCYLWRELFAPAFLARQQLLADFALILDKQDKQRRGLPEQVIIFTLGNLTPAMLDFIELLSNYTDVYLYHHCISEGYINDIVDSRWLKKAKLANPDMVDAHYDSGNRISSRFGKEDRDIARLLESQGLSENIQIIEGEATHPYSLLHEVQGQVRQLVEDADCFAEVSAQDNSLQINGCHGFLGQLEVLRSEIVRWLNDDKRRQLDDILIVLPNVASVQESIRAVFPPHSHYDGYYLPARITGVVEAETEQLWFAMTGMMQLLDDEFSSEMLLDWFSLDSVCQSYGIATEDMRLLLDQLLEAGFRRGLNLASLQENQKITDADERFTFAYALERLVSGLLMPQAPLYAEHIAPLSSITMAQQPAIEALCLFYNQACALNADLLDNKTAYEWIEYLQNRLATSFSWMENTEAYQVIEQTLIDFTASLRQQEKLYQDKIEWLLPLRFILRHVGNSLQQRQVSSEPSGVITIGNITALHGIPYQLIVFIGADQDQFPSKQIEHRHNLINIDKARIGDIHAQQSDLAAFLNLMLQAKSHFWCFYNEYESSTDEQLLPSFVVQELLDYIQEYIPASVTHYHRHHSADLFHPNSQIAVPAPLWQSVKQAMTMPSKPIKPWFTRDQQSLVNSADIIKDYDLQQVSYGLLNPVKMAVQSQNIRLNSQESMLEVLEPLQLDYMDELNLNDRLLKQAVDEQKPSTLPFLPILPIAEIGQVVFKYKQNWIKAGIEAFLAQCQSKQLSQTEMNQIELADETLIRGQLPIDKDQEWLILEFIAHSGNKGLQEYVLQPKKLLRYRLHYLLWQASCQTHRVMKIGFVDPDSELKVVEFVSLSQEDALKELQDWLNCYEMAMQGQLFDIESALIGLEKGDEKMRDAILNKEALNYFGSNQKSVVYWQLILRHQSTLIDEMMKRNKEIIIPLLSTLQKSVKI